MLRGEEEAQARTPLRHRRVDDRLNVDPSPEQPVRQGHGLEGIADDHRDHREAEAEARIEPELARRGEKQVAVLAKTLDPLRLGLHHRQGRLCRRREGWGHADAVDEAAGRMLEILDQRDRAADIAATGRQRLGQGAHPDIDLLGVDTAILEEPRARAAGDTEAVGLVHHQPRIVTLLESDEAREVRRIAVHAVEALDHDQRAAMLVARRLEQVLQGVKVVVGEGTALRPGQLNARDDAVVRKRIVKHHVARLQQGADGRDVGGVPAHHHDAPFGAIMSSERLFQADMARPLTRHHAARGGRSAVGFHGLAGSAADLRVPIEAEVIVGREVREDLLVDPRRGARLRVVDAEEGVAEADQLRTRALKLQLTVARQVFEILRRADARRLRRLGRGRPGCRPPEAVRHEAGQGRPPAVGPRRLRHRCVSLLSFSRASMRSRSGPTTLALTSPPICLAMRLIATPAVSSMGAETA